MKPFIRRLSLALVFVLMLAMIGCDVLGDTPAKTEKQSLADKYPEPEGSPFEDYAGLNLDEYITLPDYASMSLEIRIPEITDKEIQAGIHELLQDFNTSGGQSYYEHLYQDENGTPLVLKEHDFVKFHSSATVDGEVMDGTILSWAEISLEDGCGYIDGFWNMFIGHSVGETFTSSLKFPDEYLDPAQYPEDAARLNGKEAIWTITVLYVAGDKVDPTELTDEIVKEFFDAEDVDSFVEEYGDMLKETAESTAVNNASAQAWDKVYQAATVLKYPEGSVEYYYAYLMNQLAVYGDYYGYNLARALSENNFTNEESVMDYCRDWVKDYLVLNAVIKKESIDVSVGFESWLVQTAAEAGVSVDTFIQYYNSNYGSGYLLEVYQADLVNKTILAKMTVTRTYVPVEENAAVE